MKGFRGTLIFAVFVAAIAGLAYWGHKRNMQEAQEKTINANIFHALKSDNVVEFDMSGPKKTYKLKKSGDSWQLIAPVTDRANDEAVHSELTGIFSQSTVSPDTDGVTIDWSKYGLDNPDYTLDFQFADGKHETLKVGRVRTYDNGYYLRRDNENELLVGNNGWDTILGKDVNDLRYMKPEFSKADFQVVSIHSARKDKKFDYEISHADNKWSLAKQPNVKLDNGEVNTWINGIRDLLADQVVSNTKETADLKKYNLLRPEIKIEVAYENPAKTKHFLALSAVKDGEIYWYSSDNPGIYKIGSLKADPLLKNPDDLRDRMFVFKFDVAQAAHLIYKRTTDASSGKKGAPKVKPVEVSLDKVNGEWQLQNPDPKKQVNQEQVKDFLNYLSGLEAVRFLKHKRPAALHENAVEVQDDKGKVLLSLQFGGTITDKLNKKAKIEYYAAKSSKTDEYFAVTKATLDDLANKNMVQAAQKTTPTPPAMPNGKNAKGKAANPPAGASKTATGRVNETKTVKGKK